MDWSDNIQWKSAIVNVENNIQLTVPVLIPGHIKFPCILWEYTPVITFLHQPTSKFWKNQCNFGRIQKNEQSV